MALVQGPDKQINRQRFEKLVEEHQTSLLRGCYLYLKDHAMAEDAVQETFLKAYRSMEAFRGESSEITWLTRIAINVCRDMQRTTWFRLIDRFTTPEMLPEPAQEFTEPEESLVLSIMNLPRKLREVVVLYYYQNFDTQEIAETLGIARSSVSSRLKRARVKLREVLERMDSDEG